MMEVVLIFYGKKHNINMCILYANYLYLKLQVVPIEMSRIRIPHFLILQITFYNITFFLSFLF